MTLGRLVILLILARNVRNVRRPIGYISSEEKVISKETFNQIIENGPNDVFIDNAGIIWEFYEIRRNKPVYKKVWVIDGNKYDYTEDYQSLVREIGG